MEDSIVKVSIIIDGVDIVLNLSEKDYKELNTIFKSLDGDKKFHRNVRLGDYLLDVSSISFIQKLY